MMSSSLQMEVIDVDDDYDDDDGPAKVLSSSVSSSPTTAVVPSTTETTTIGSASTASACFTPRRSGRQRNSTVTYIDGHAVLKSNNYVVKGTSYHFATEGEEALSTKGGSVKKGRDTAGPDHTPSEGSAAKKIKTDNHSSKQRQHNPSFQEIQRKAHNERIKLSKESKQGLRLAFLRGHANVLMPFLEDSVYHKLIGRNYHNTNDNRKMISTSNSRTVSQPKLITGGTLRDYQLDGLKFMVGHHERNLGIILGDEMGLGKTVQTISLLCHIKERANAKGPSLVVCPLSVLSSWWKELTFWAPTLKVLQLHGSTSSQGMYRKNLSEEGFLYDVVLTTYEMVKAPGLATSISRLHFNYLVLDEGHRVKGHETQIAAAVRRVHCENRLLLTGTPLQNNLIELWSLLELLYPDVFTTSVPFAQAFDLTENHVDADMLLKAQKVLDLFMIRRLKSRVESLLPSKLETRVYCPLSKTQIFWYKSILLKDLAKLEKAERDLSSSGASSGSNNDDDEDDDDDEEDPVSKSAKQLLTNLFMQLRKCSQHPFLFPGAEGPNLNDTALIDLIAASGKLSVLDMLLRSLFQKNHRVVLFSQFTMVLDLLEDYCSMRGWQCARFDGGTSRAKRSFLVNQFNADDSPFFLFLMSTKAGGIGLNLQSADTCILFDSDWNPQNDLQAMARVHRIGQTKKVHIYRLISANTVEERIVERAAKKLLLDQAVNRDSDTSITAPADEKGTGLSAKELLRDIKFGCQAIFGGKTNMELPSLKEIDEITNRQRNHNDSIGKLTGGTEENGADFDSEKEFTASQIFGGMDYREIRAKHEQKMKKEMPKTLAGIGRLWNEIKEIQGTKRKVKKRLVMVDGIGSGYGSACVPVLASNNYDLESGESSVFDREISHSKKRNFAVPSKKPRQFENSSYCQVCLDGGLLVCCSLCPVSLHIQCIGLSRENDFARCPHHRCNKCGKNGKNAGGFLYPCSVCTNCYCDECLPKNEQGFRMLGKNERFEELGFNTTKRTAYIHCSAECEKFAKAEYGWELGKTISTCPEHLDFSFNFGNEDELDIGEELTAGETCSVISSEEVRGRRAASIAAKETMKMLKTPGRGNNLPAPKTVVKSEAVPSHPHSVNAAQPLLNHNESRMIMNDVKRTQHRREESHADGKAFVIFDLTDSP